MGKTSEELEAEAQALYDKCESIVSGETKIPDGEDAHCFIYRAERRFLSKFNQAARLAIGQRRKELFKKVLELHRTFIRDEAEGERAERRLVREMTEIPPGPAPGQGKLFD